LINCRHVYEEGHLQELDDDKIFRSFLMLMMTLTKSNLVQCRIGAMKQQELLVQVCQTFQIEQSRNWKVFWPFGLLTCLSVCLSVSSKQSFQSSVLWYQPPLPHMNVSCPLLVWKYQWIGLLWNPREQINLCFCMIACQYLKKS